MLTSEPCIIPIGCSFMNIQYGIESLNNCLLCSNNSDIYEIECNELVVGNCFLNGHEKVAIAQGRRRSRSIC